MKKIKRFLVLTLFCTMVLVLPACGSSTPVPASATPAPTSTATDATPTTGVPATCRRYRDRSRIV